MLRPPASDQLIVIDKTNGGTYAMNLPNVYRVAVNQGDSVVLAMVRNSNTLYRLLRLNQNQPAVPGAVKLSALQCSRLVRGSGF